MKDGMKIYSDDGLRIRTKDGLIICDTSRGELDTKEAQQWTRNIARAVNCHERLVDMARHLAMAYAGNAISPVDLEDLANLLAEAEGGGMMKQPEKRYSEAALNAAQEIHALTYDCANPCRTLPEGRCQPGHWFRIECEKRFYEIAAIVDENIKGYVLGVLQTAANMVEEARADKEADR